MKIALAAVLLAVGVLFAGCGPLTPAQLEALRAIAEDAPPPAPPVFPDYTAGYSPPPNMSFTLPSGPVLSCSRHCVPLSPQAELLDMAAGR